jgi:HemY protein
MIRGALLLLAIAALMVVIAAMVGQPGHASIDWLGWRLDTTAAAAVMLIALGALAAVTFWRTVLWVARAPERAARARLQARRRQGTETLTRGFLAVLAGDGAEARRSAARAAELVEDAPALVRVLAAQAAEAAGDIPAAQGAYTAMLGFPDMKLAGHRGLMLLALSQGDRKTALANAEAAYGLTRTARWAWTALLEARLDDGDWTGALDLVKGAQDRKIVPPLVAERTRAALLAALAASLEDSADPKAKSQAADYALDAARLKPGFSPGPVMAARLLAADGKPGRASSVIESAWKAAPHPALWMAYRDLQTHETPRERAGRLRELAALNPAHRESRMLMVEQALIVNDAEGARQAATPLLLEPPTQRLCALMARTAFAAGDADEARAWIARSGGAPQEPDWSDLDPEGRAFAYTPKDWSRLVAAYAETGELIHPRLERQERTISELPELPISYQASAPFLRAAEAGAAAAPLPDDPGPPDAEGELAPAAPEAAAGGPRRLGSRPRRR